MTKSDHRLQSDGKPDIEGDGNPGSCDEAEELALSEENGARRWRSWDALADLFGGPEDPAWPADRDRIAHWVHDAYHHARQAEQQTS